MISRFSVLILATAALATNAVQGSTPRDAVEELLKADRAFSAAAAQMPIIDALPKMFADDVILPAPGKGFVDGRAQAIEALRANPDNLTGRAEWTPIRGGVSRDGQHGFTYGYMTVRRSDGTTVPIKYLSYWIRKPEGWRVAAYKRRPRPAGDVSLEIMAPSLPDRIVPTTKPAPPELIEGLKTTENAFSAEAQRIGIGEAFTKYGSADAANMGGPEDAAFVISAQAIGRSVGAGTAPGTSPVSWSADRAIVSPSGDLGITFGIITPNDKSQPRSIPFFTIWRRTDTSQPWRYIAE